MASTPPAPLLLAPPDAEDGLNLGSRPALSICLIIASGSVLSRKKSGRRVAAGDGKHSTFFNTTVRCHYNTVNYLKNILKRHPIPRPLGRGMGCLLWIQHLFGILPEFLQSFMQYLTILDRVITALNCI